MKLKKLLSESVDINQEKWETNDTLYYRKCFLNRCVFRCFLKVPMLSMQRETSGSAFHKDGAYAYIYLWEKAISWF